MGAGAGRATAVAGGPGPGPDALAFNHAAEPGARAPRAAALLQALAEPCRQRCGVELTFHARQKGDDGRAQADALLAAALASGEPPVLGVLPKARARPPGS
jgi:hypothetical protein